MAAVTKDDPRWERWLNGEVWKLMRGRDFYGDIEEFRLTALSAAADRNLSCATSEYKGVVELQAVEKKRGAK